MGAQSTVREEEGVELLLLPSDRVPVVQQQDGQAGARTPPDVQRFEKSSKQPLLDGADGGDAASCRNVEETDSLLSSSSEGGGEAAVLPKSPPRFRWMGFFSFFGSGLLMSVAYLDPGNLEASIQVGVQAGYSLLWWYAFCSIVLGVAFQNLAGRLGLVTGEDLAQHCGRRYPKFARWLLWFVLEIAIVGADIQETIGSAIAISILTNGRIPLAFGCVMISLTAFALLLLERTGFRQLEAVFGAFIAVEAISLGINFFQADVPAKDLAVGLFVPQLSNTTLQVAVGALGAMVMPYNVFFQSSVVNKRPRDSDTDDKKKVLINYMRVENLFVLVMAFIINIFVVCVFAKGFYTPNTGNSVSGSSDVAQELGLETAGDHLAEVYGVAFKYLWAVGLLAAGQVSTIGLTYAGQLVMTGLLDIKVQAGTRMVITRSVALVPTVLLAVAFEASNTFDVVAQLLNIVQSLVLPFALIPVIYITSCTDIMGEKFVNGRWLTWLTGSITVMVLGVNGYLLASYLMEALPNASGAAWFGFSLIFLAYYLASLYFAVGPENVPWMLRKVRSGLGQLCCCLRSSNRWRDCESMLEVHW